MKASAPAVSPVQTQHPFGDPSSTRIHQRDELLRELMSRTTNMRMKAPTVVVEDQLAPVSGEITGPRDHRWTVFAIVLLLVTVGVCVTVAMA